MLKTRLQQWVQAVESLLTTQGTSSGLLSTERIIHRFNLKNQSDKHLVTHRFIPCYPLSLSTPYITKSPLLNTSFTQFPQRLLLQRTKKKEEI